MMTTIKMGTIIEVHSIKDKFGRVGGCVIVESASKPLFYPHQYTILLGGLPAIVVNRMEDVRMVINAFNYSLGVRDIIVNPEDPGSFNGCVGSNSPSVEG